MKMTYCRIRNQFYKLAGIIIILIGIICFIFPNPLYGQEFKKKW